MFCKFCGKLINKETMCCTGCGKEAGPLEGGVGFWDLAGAKPPVSHNNALLRDDKKIKEIVEHLLQKTKRQNKRISLLVAVVAGLFVLSLTFNVVLFGMVLGLKQETEQISQSVCELRKQFKEQPDAYGEETLPPETTAPTQVPQESVDTEPESNASNLEDFSLCLIYRPETWIPGEDPLSFIFETNGMELNFQWKKWDPENSEWSSADNNLFLTETNESRDGRLRYLINYNSKEHSENAYGRYKLYIFDANEELLSTETIWIEKAESVRG